MSKGRKQRISGVSLYVGTQERAEIPIFNVRLIGVATGSVFSRSS